MELSYCPDQKQLFVALGYILWNWKLYLKRVWFVRGYSIKCVVFEVFTSLFLGKVHAQSCYMSPTQLKELPLLNMWCHRRNALPLVAEQNTESVQCEQLFMWLRVSNWILGFPLWPPLCDSVQYCQTSSSGQAVPFTSSPFMTNCLHCFPECMKSTMRQLLEPPNPGTYTPGTQCRRHFRLQGLVLFSRHIGWDSYFLK